jgi:hypothetical protein
MNVNYVMGRQMEQNAPVQHHLVTICMSLMDMYILIKGQGLE